MHIKIYTMGGTIDKTYFDQKNAYHVGEPQAAGVLQRANVVVEYEVESIVQKDSLDMTDSDRATIRNAIASDPAEIIIVTHGTDTMVQTAICLQGIPDKTIVLTGSMYPAQYRDSDAVFNLGCALMAAQVLNHGVYIAMNGRIFDPQNTVKNVAQNRFEEKSTEHLEYTPRERNRSGITFGNHKYVIDVGSQEGDDSEMSFTK